MKHRHAHLLCLAAASTMMWTSCKSDDPKENPDGPGGKGEMTEMTPEQSKEYISNTALELMNMFNPADQQKAIGLAAYFQDTYGNFDMPEEFQDKEDIYAPIQYMQGIRRAAAGDMDALTRSVYSYTYNINFDRFAGIYEPVSSRREWVKTGESKDIIFTFKDATNRTCEVKATKGSGTSDFEFSYHDNDYYNQEKYDFYLSIPKEVNVIITLGGETLSQAKVVSDIDVNGRKVNADVTATLCNLRVVASLRGTDNKLQGNTEVYVSNKKVLTAYATINGQDLCNKKKYEDLLNYDHNINKDNDDIINSMVTDGSCGGDVLGKVQVYAQFTNYDGLFDDLDGYWDSYSYREQSTAKDLCEKTCDKLNTNIKTQVRYNGTTTDQATLKFAPFLDTWDSGWGNTSWEYTVESQIKFPDGTIYSVESYFEKFTTVSNKWDALFDSYKLVWDNAFPRKK